MLLQEDARDIDRKRIFDITYPEEYIETREMLMAKYAYISTCMRIRQGEVENEVSKLRNQLDKNKLSYDVKMRSMNELIQELKEKHEKQNTKKIFKISELEDKIVLLEEELDENFESQMIRDQTQLRKNSGLRDEISNLNKGIPRIKKRIDKPY